MKGALPFDSAHYARRPEGLVVTWQGDRSAPRHDLGSYFASCACLEAASVVAFTHLVADLKSRRAPPALVDMAERAQEDGMLHAERTMRLARQFAKPPTSFAVKKRRVRTRVEIARDNAAEGCVREAFGAAVGLWQAKHAKGKDVREAFALMGTNKLRHVELAWTAAEWLDRSLDARERASVETARTTALTALQNEIALPLAPVLVDVAGVPPMQTALSLFDAIKKQIDARCAA